jgi:hypothetical protein
MAETEASLDELVVTFTKASLSEATKSTYRSQLTSYLKFCIKYDYQPVPASTLTLCRYIAHLTLRLKYSSVKQYLNVVRILHLEYGLNNPLADNYGLKSVLKGVRRLQGDSVSRKSPITMAILVRIRACLDFQSSVDCAFWAACLLAFYGMLRKSSMFPIHQHLMIGCVKVLSWGIVVTFSYSKTVQHQERQPFISLPWNDHVALCPCRALFCSWTKSKAFSQCDPLFPIRTVGMLKPLSRVSFSTKLQAIFQGLGLSGYSGHSFRRGGASHALASGVPVEIIKAQGDWRSLAYLDYLNLDSSLSRAHQIQNMYTN